MLLSTPCTTTCCTPVHRAFLRAMLPNSKSRTTRTHTSRVSNGCPYRISHTHTHTDRHTHDCKTNGHNAVSECQNPRQLERQTRQSMFATNRRLSGVTGTDREELTSRGMHHVQDEFLGGLWQLHCTRSLYRTNEDRIPRQLPRSYPSQLHTHTHTHPHT
jgi:hypothetical protein